MGRFALSYDLLPHEDHGIIILFHSNFIRCDIVGFKLLEAFACALPNSTANYVIQYLILMINRIEDVWKPQDVKDMFDGYICVLTGAYIWLTLFLQVFTPCLILGMACNSSLLNRRFNSVSLCHAMLSCNHPFSCYAWTSQRWIDGSTMLASWQLSWSPGATPTWCHCSPGGAGVETCDQL